MADVARDEESGRDWLVVFWRAGLLAPQHVVMLCCIVDLDGAAPDPVIAAACSACLALAGPLLLPFASASLSARISLVDALSAALDHWRVRGTASWLGHGLLVGTVSALPYFGLFLGQDGVVGLLLAPLSIRIALYLGSTWRRVEPTAPTTPSRAHALVGVLCVLAPLLVATAVPCSMWQVDRRPVDHSRLVHQVHPGVEVGLQDAPFFVIGVRVSGPSEYLVRAPLGIFASLSCERGRARLLWSDEDGGYSVPISPTGHRLDDGLEGRLRARLDLGGAFPLRSALVLLAITSLALTRFAAARARVAAHTLALVTVMCLWWAL